MSETTERARALRDDFADLARSGALRKTALFELAALVVELSERLDRAEHDASQQGMRSAMRNGWSGQ